MSDCITRIRVGNTKTRIRVGCQGMPGPPGLPGGASDSIIVQQTDDVLLPGNVVYTTAISRFELAIGNGYPQTRAVGLSHFATGAGSAATVQTQDIITLLTTDWDAVTGQTGGLSIGAVYYLSQTSPGMLMTTPPVADPPNVRFNSRIGIALSATKLNVLIRAPIQL